jgi:hypothetical protein
VIEVILPWNGSSPHKCGSDIVVRALAAGSGSNIQGAGVQELISSEGGPGRVRITSIIFRNNFYSER